MDSQADWRPFLDHLLRAIQYRVDAVLEGAPAGFPALSIGAGVRTPVEILSHISDVLGYSVGRPEPGWVGPEATGDWEGRVTQAVRVIRFHLDQPAAPVEFHRAVPAREVVT